MAGVIVALANHNAKDGMAGQRFETDDDGRFEVTGLTRRPQGYELAFVGSFGIAVGSRRQRVVPGEDARVTLTPAVPYRLQLADPHGNPADREVYSIEVQQTPGAVRRDVKTRFHDADARRRGSTRGSCPGAPQPFS